MKESQVWGARAKRESQRKGGGSEPSCVSPPPPPTRGVFFPLHQNRMAVPFPVFWLHPEFNL